MIDPKSMAIWWGKLESPEADIPVIFDPSLPGMPTGQICMYNAVRNAIVPYHSGVVQQFLRDMEPSELKAIKKALGKKWRAARKEYVKHSMQSPLVAGDK